MAEQNNGVLRRFVSRFTRNVSESDLVLNEQLTKFRAAFEKVLDVEEYQYIEKELEPIKERLLNSPNSLDVDFVEEYHSGIFIHDSKYYEMDFVGYSDNRPQILEEHAEWVEVQEQFAEAEEKALADYDEEQERALEHQEYTEIAQIKADMTSQKVAERNVSEPDLVLNEQLTRFRVAFEQVLDVEEFQYIEKELEPIKERLLTSPNSLDVVIVEEYHSGIAIHDSKYEGMNFVEYSDNRPRILEEHVEWVEEQEQFAEAEEKSLADYDKAQERALENQEYTEIAELEEFQSLARARLIEQFKDAGYLNMASKIEKTNDSFINYGFDFPKVAFSESIAEDAENIIYFPDGTGETVFAKVENVSFNPDMAREIGLGMITCHLPKINKSELNKETDEFEL